MHQEIVEGPHLDFAVAGRQFEGRDLSLDHRHAFVDIEERPLADVGRDADDQPIDQARRPADDVGMAIGDGIEGARVDRDTRLGHLPPSASPAGSSSARWATETTRSPSATLNNTTPWVLRPTMRISWTGQRMSWPPSVTSMI